MDDTKKVLLSIDIDTGALSKNVKSAKDAVASLAEQLKELKASGKEGGEALSGLAGHLKQIGEEAQKSNSQQKEFSKGLSESAKVAKDLKNSSAELSTQYQKNTDDTTKSAASLDVLKLRYSASNDQVKALKEQFRALTNESITLTETHGKSSAGVRALQAQLLGLNGQIKNAKATNLEYKQAIDTLNTSQQNAAKQNEGAATETSKYSKTLKEYGGDLIKAAEDASPVIKSIVDTAEKVKAAREVVGQLSDAFSAYKDKLSAAHESSTTFNTAAGEGAQAFKVLKTGTEVAEGGVKSFSSALASTGIGLVIIAVSALMDYLKQFTPLVEFTERVTAGLSGSFNALGRIVLDLISPLKKVFTDPKQAIIDLGKFILDNIINRFKAAGVIINSILHPSLKGLADGFIQLSTGVTNATDKIAGYGKTIVKAGEDTAKLKGEQQELNRSMQDEALKAAETEAKIAEQRVKIQTGNLAQRKAALAEIAMLEAGQAKLHKDNIEKGAELAIKDVAIKRGLTQQEIELIKSKGAAELDLLVKNNRIYADDVEALSESLTKKYELIKEHYSKIETASTQHYIKRKQQNKAGQPDAKNNANNRATEPLEAKQASLNIPDASTTQQALENNKKFNDAIANQNKSWQKEESEAYKEWAKNHADTVKKYQDEGIAEQAKIDAQIAAKTKHDADKTSAYKKKLEDEAEAHLKLSFDDEMKLLDKRYKSYENTYTNLGNLFSKNTQASKAALIAKKATASAEIAISTEQSIAATILATKLAVANDHTMGPIIGTILAAIDIASGAAEVVATAANGAKQIRDIGSVSFARGGVYQSDGYGTYLTGPGTSTSDSINARLSNGESVINARSTAMFAPILSAINMAGGGRAFNATANGNGYALGGLFNGSNTLNDGSNELATTRATTDMVRLLAANLPRQVLVVEDVQASLQNKVMLQNMSNF